MNVRQQFFERLATIVAPRVLELGTRGWDGKLPRHGRAEVLAANPSARWLGVDARGGPGVDVVADAHELGRHFGLRAFDAFVCPATLEHCRRPWVVARELAAVVRAGGLGLVETHQSFPLHGYPDDYFRFSREALAEVFAPDAGWAVVASAYQTPCKVVPTENAFVHAYDWNFEAEAWLNVLALVERLP